jgi:hypothetical protein
MLAPQITNYVQDGLSKLLQQYKGRALITGALTAFLQQAQNIENALYPLEGLCQIWNGTTVPAFGAQLDGIGELVGITRNGLPDDEYALFIFGKIAENFSDDTTAAVLTVAAYLFQAPIMLMQPTYPAGIAIEALGIPIPKQLWSLAAQLIQQSMGAGINLVVAGSTFTNAFRFDGPGIVGTVNGFGSGLFVDLIM